MFERDGKFISSTLAILMITLVSACVSVGPGESTVLTQAPSSTAAPNILPEPTGASVQTRAPRPDVEAPATLSVGVNLVISSLEFVPDTIAAGEETLLRLAVRNIGSVASPPFNVGFSYTMGGGGGGGLRAVSEPDGLLPGVEKNYEVPGLRLDPDVYSFMAEVDNDNQIDEDDEDDNEAQATLTVTPPPPGPNLVISSFTITPEDICVQDEATFEFSVSNAGSVPAEDFFLVLNYAQIAAVEGFTGSYQGPFFRVLNPGDTANASTSHVLNSAGDYIFTAVVDADNNVAEENETDNEAVAEIYVC